MEADAVEPIAIIGMSVKFPQDATSPEAFWDMLEAGRSAASKVPVDRFNVDGKAKEQLESKTDLPPHPTLFWY